MREIRLSLVAHCKREAVDAPFGGLTERLANVLDPVSVLVMVIVGRLRVGQQQDEPSARPTAIEYLERMPNKGPRRWYTRVSSGAQYAPSPSKL